MIDLFSNISSDLTNNILYCRTHVKTKNQIYIINKINKYNYILILIRILSCQLNKIIYIASKLIN